MDYQPIFDENFAKFDDEEKYGRYGQLVLSLEAVFKAAGYDITGDELAGSQHNHIVCAIGLTMLPDIARHFVSWIQVESQPNYRVRSVAEAYLPMRLYDLRRDTNISPHILTGWENFLKDHKKAQSVKGRKGKQYEAWIAGIAAVPSVRERMVSEAQTILDDRQRKIAAIRVELEEENEKAVGHIAHLRRTAHIVDAFCHISGIADSANKAAALREMADRVERGLNIRRESAARLGENQPSAEDVVESSLTQYAEKLPELTAVWAAIKTKQVELCLEKN